MAALPFGTVTFLFTDIEGSTRMWDESPEAMRVALARHDSLMRMAIREHNGYVFKTIGDAFCAAFTTATDALSAALTAQRALNREAWPTPESLQVRMAIHTGAVESRDDDYFGQPLNRTARLLATGHGGQVLLSDVAHDLCRDSLPTGCLLTCLGDHRLRDLDRPESVFQLLHPSLNASFPPLKSLDNPSLPNNLPQQLTSFIGREREISEITDLLKKTRLLSLSGSGGSGKTRLAMQAAAELLEQYADGVWLVELASVSVSDGALAAQTVAQALQISERSGQPMMQTLCESLKNKHLLLLLDNCEHLLAPCAAIASALLRTCPHIKIVATTREAIGIGGELTYRVPSLSSPDPKHVATSQSLSQYEAVRLFIERARFHKPEFTVTDQNAPALASVCQRLDGIPLAIELSAARVRSLSVEEINTRLNSRFRLLTGGDRSALPRHQTLRALIDWSYDLLNDTEKALLGRLSVFCGGWTMNAAEQVCAGDCVEPWQILDMLASLVDKSLVVSEEQSGSTRCRLLETVKQYAADRLVESGSSMQFRNRHRDYFLEFAEVAEPHLRGSDQVEWFHQLESEHDNLRAAQDWCLETYNISNHANEVALEAALRFCGALRWFWIIRGYLQEGAKRSIDAVELARAGHGSSRLADGLRAAGTCCMVMADYAASRRYYEEELTLRREAGDRNEQARALVNLGVWAREHHDYVQAALYFNEAVSLADVAEIPRTTGWALGGLGTIALLKGEVDEAKRLTERAIIMSRQFGLKDLEAEVLTISGLTELAQGDTDAAYARLAEALKLSSALQHRLLIPAVLTAFSRFHEAGGDLPRSITLLAIAESFRARLGTQFPAYELIYVEAAISRLRLSTGEESFSAAWDKARLLTLERAVEYALHKPKAVS